MKKKMKPCVPLIFAVLVTLGGCKQKPVTNQVDMDQIDVDNSTKYRHIFREEIQGERDRDDRRAESTREHEWAQ